MHIYLLMPLEDNGWIIECLFNLKQGQYNPNPVDQPNSIKTGLHGSTYNVTRQYYKAAYKVEFSLLIFQG